MDAADVGWTSLDVPELGVSIELAPGWTPAVTRLGSTDHLVLTAPGGDGVVFVRSGPDESLDGFVAGLGDLMTTASVVARDERLLAGHMARRVEIAATREAHDAYLDDPDLGPVHVPQPELRERIVVLEPARPSERAPILVGYRLPEARLAELAPVAERLIAGVRLAPGTGKDSRGVRSPTDAQLPNIS